MIINGALLRYRRVMVMTYRMLRGGQQRLRRGTCFGARRLRDAFFPSHAGIRSVLDRHSRGAGAILATTGEGQMVVGGVAGRLFDRVGNRF